MEFAILTLRRSLDLAKQYEPVHIGSHIIGLQTVQDDVAEIEIQGPDAITHVEIPVGTAAEAQGFTFINRDVGIALPEKKKRFRLFGGGKRDIPEDGIMEAVLGVRWGNQSLRVDDPEDNQAYDFMLVRQYASIKDRPFVYTDQDTLVFGELALQLGPRIQEDDKQYENPKYAEFRVKLGDDEEEKWQVKLDGDYHRKGKYRLMVTSYDIHNEWYQAAGISVAEGRVKGEIDETQRHISAGLSSSDTGGSEISRTRLDEAEADEHEAVMKAGDTVNIGKVGVKLLEINPGEARIMLLSPKIARTTLQHGEVFEFGKWDVSLVGVHGEKAIIRIAES